MCASKWVLRQTIFSLMASAVFLLLTADTYAQVTVSNPWTPYDPIGMLTGSTVQKSFNGLESDVSLANGAVSLYLPVLTISQRAGAAPLVLAYSATSNHWAPEEDVDVSEGILAGPSNPTGQSTEYDEFTYTESMTDHQPGGDLQIVLPRLQASIEYVGDNSQTDATGVETQWPVFCVMNWAFTDWHGDTHSFPGPTECSDQTEGTGGAGATIATLQESSDGSFYRLDTSNLSDIVVTDKNGTQYHFKNFTDPWPDRTAEGGESVNASTERYYDSYFTSESDPNGSTMTLATTKSGLDGPSSESYTLTDTLGRTYSISPDGIEYTDSNGSQQTISDVGKVLSTTSVSWPDFSCVVNDNNPPPAPQYTIQPMSTGPITLTQTQETITIPTPSGGLVYTFTFNGLGQPIKVVLPSGGYQRYDYSTIDTQYEESPVDCTGDFQVIAHKYECANASGSCSTEAKTTYAVSPNSVDSLFPVTVTGPAPFNYETTHMFTAAYLNGVPKETETQYYNGSGTLMRTVRYTYWTSASSESSSKITDASQPTAIADTIYGAGSAAYTKTTDISYQTVTAPWQCMDTENGCTFPVGPSETQVYGYSNNLLRTTTEQWMDTGVYTPSSSNILDLLQSKTETDPATSKSNTVTNTYDNLGNLTSVTESGTGTSTYSVSYSLDSYGRPLTATDTLGNKTTFSYGDNWGNSACAPSSNSSAYLTSVTAPTGEQTSYSYNSCTGTLASRTDANAQPTGFAYDSAGRLTAICTPDSKGQLWSGGTCSTSEATTQVSYDDTVGSTSYTVTKIPSQSGTPVTTETILDGFSRPIEQLVTSDPYGAMETDTQYDSMGRIAAVSNPYRPSDGSPQFTQYQYDALNRQTSLTHPDGTVLTTNYSGPETQIIDEGNGSEDITRIDTADALGRTTSVCEVNGSSAEGSTASDDTCTNDWKENGYLTSYTYDAFGNLTGVTQNGLASRSFVYDGLSRLTSSTNPETGTTTYSYANSGSPCSANPADVCSRTDANGTTTTYSYDQDNNLIEESYSDGTPPAYFSYQHGNGATSNNANGKIVEEYTGSSSSPYTSEAINQYGPMGRIENETQCAWGTCTASNTLVDTYDYLGDITSWTNGASNTGILLTAGYDGAGRLSLLTSSWSDATHPDTLLKANADVGGAAPYGPFGLTAAQIGYTTSSQNTAITLTRGYDDRGREISENYEGIAIAPATSGSGSLTITGSEQTKGSTSATGSVTVSGSEQSKQKQTSAATSSSGSISISGSEQSSTTPAQPGVATVLINGSDQYRNGGYDTGYVSFSVDGAYASIYYSSSSTGTSLASSLASQLNYSGSPVTATAYGPYVTITSVATGAASDYDWNGSSYSLGGFNPPSFTFMPTGGTMTGGTNASTTYDSGTVTATLDGCSASTSYGQSSTASSVASGLASALTSSCGSLVTVSASGSVVSLTSKATGTSVNWGISTSVSYDSGKFSSASFGASPSGMAGGKNAVDTTVYDSGSVTVTVNGYSKSTSFGQNDTPTTIASNLAAAINGDSSEPVTASASGATLALATKHTGSTVNYSLSASDSYDSTDFSQSSFTASASGSSLTGGTGTSQATVYDSGTVSLTIDGTEETASYGQGDTPSSVASKLASAFSGSTVVAVTASGATVQMTARAAGSATNYSYSVAESYDSTDFSSPSFTGSPSSGSLSGGANQNTTSTSLYSFAVPSGGYAGDGDLLDVNDSVIGDWAYHYDTLNRLVTASSSSGYFSGLDLTWAYDRFGNRWSQTASGNTNISLTQPESLTFNGGNNRADQFTYDNDGHVKQDPANQYLYDAEGRVCAVDSSLTGVTLYLYNAMGERVAKGSGSFSCNLSSNGFTLTHRYVLDLAGRQMTEFDGSGNWIHTNVFANGQLLATYSASGNALHFALNDWQGTKRVQAKADGEFEASFISLPYGDQLVSGTGATEQFFTGKARDQESGNDYFGARYYSNAYGRWLSPDWSAKIEPVPYAKIDNPQSLNLYEYLGDNPLSGVDADGHGNCNGSGSPVDACAAQKANEARQSNQPKQQAQQQSLSNAQNAAINNPNFQPNTPRRGITHCNQASCSVARAMHAPMGPLTDAHGNPLLANQIRANLAKSGSGYHTVSATEAAQLASHGVVVFVTGPGHIATVAADQSQNLPGRGPIIANVGYKNGDMRLDYVFRRSDMPEVRFYTPNQ